MAKIGSFPISWKAVEDAAYYRIYVLPHEYSDEVTERVESGEFYLNNFSEVPAITYTDTDTGRVVVPLANKFSGVVNSGTYDVFVTALDAAGNESDPALLDNVELDFTAPDAPTELRLGK